MKNYHVIKVKYMGPTNFKGSRIRLTSDRFKQSVTIPYNYDFSTSYEMAECWLMEKGFNIVGLAETIEGYIIITDTFEPLKSN